MALKYEINADEILSQLKDFKEEVKKNMEEAVANLMTLTKARIVEQTSQLSSATAKTYLDALGEPEMVAPGVWIITLDPKAFWIEEGIEANKDMKPGILKGKSSVRVPFRYDKPGSQNSPLTNALVMEINQKLRKDKLSVSKIEKDASGSPKIGKLHEFDLSGPGKHVSWLKRNEKETHALTRINVYQNKDEKAKGGVRRDVMVFRTVSSGPASANKWIHPGYEAKKFMDKAMDKAIRDWEDQILPEILAKWNK